MIMDIKSHSQPHKVLLVEDDDIDAMAVQRSFKKIYPDAIIVRAKHGQEALDKLHLEPLPDLILMDIRMPILDGREALREIKSDKTLRKIPVIMTSTSSDHLDVNYCYENHANSYIVKPDGVKASDAMIENIIAFWLRTSTRAVVHSSLI